MYPVLISIGDISISSFGFMIVVAFLSTNYILKKDFIRYGYDPNFDIQWPFEPFVISEKDANHPNFNFADHSTG